MTKEEFIIYVRAIVDMEIETAKKTNPIFPKDERYKTPEGLKEFVADPTVASQEPQYELIGALKLIEEALNKISVPNTSPDWIYRPEHQPYYTINCTTNPSNPIKK